MSMVNNIQDTRRDQGNRNVSFKIRNFMINNCVTVLFLVICLAGVVISRLPLFFIANELLIRITRDSFLVLSLIIPVLAGMGLNFSITIGAMAAQISIIIVTHFSVPGIYGFVLCAILSVPLAILFGNLTGRLLNKTRGQEMIAGMIVGFFANGLYQFLFLFLVGSLIPMNNPELIIPGGVGIRNSIDLSRNNGIMYSLDNICKLPLFNVLLFVGIIATGFFMYKLLNKNNEKAKRINRIKQVTNLILSLAIVLLSLSITFISSLPNEIRMLKNLKLPIATSLAVGFLCLFNILIVRTKLGQDFRTVGNSQHIAEVSGINVDKVRVLAITISTVLAAWGQLIFLQNLGTLNTYGSHVQIATFSIAALLIGGASVSKATVGQALLGVILFHTLFIVSPNAGKNLFGEAQIGEFFRAFFAYGVIGVSLGLHAWRKRIEMKNKL
ncbi:ABC transporter permease [Proteiniborus sp. MB09-C3]|uniref:ABC transporter permease subunit n=1 Tax=Proteiniborus sp. MB09-C3 TaxID=3050072 RepID=UPI002555D63E|nr:ABC transporter permease [Proteiniborus sp. MB09-C3]WIV10741.1 ABC transporter permease [Proteiniborus sp. MB09-C3]